MGVLAYVRRKRKDFIVLAYPYLDEPPLENNLENQLNEIKKNMEEHKFTILQ